MHLIQWLHVYLSTWAGYNCDTFHCCRQFDQLKDLVHLLLLFDCGTNRI